MAYTTQYIGSRYVPVFADPAEWNSTRTYEPLTIVLHEGNSYTSRQYVPEGIDLTNEDYWLETGNYNAQVEAYRSDVLAYHKDMFRYYATVADMQADKSLKIGQFAITSMFSNIPNSGAIYIISEGTTANGMDKLLLSNNYVAQLIPRDMITPMQLGADNTGSRDVTSIIQYCVNNYKIVDGMDGIFLVGKGNATIDIDKECKIINSNFHSNTGASSLEYMFNIYAKTCIKDCSFTFDATPSVSNRLGAIQIHGYNNAISHCEFYNFAYAITNDYFNDNTKIANGKYSDIYTENCRCVIHLSNINATINNVIANGTYITDLLSDVFYLRTNVNAVINNVQAFNYDGSIVHCNRMISGIATPPYSTAIPNKTTVLLNNFYAYNVGRIIDINSYVDATITNGIIGNYKYKHITGAIEYRVGYGIIKVENVIVEDESLNSVLVTDDSDGGIPNNSPKELHISNCIFHSAIGANVEITTPTLISVKNSELHRQCFVGNNFTVEYINNVSKDAFVAVQIYKTSNAYIVGNTKLVTTPLLNLTSTSSNCVCLVSNNNIYSSTQITNNGTNNTIKDNNNYSFH